MCAKIFRVTYYEEFVLGILNDAYLSEHIIMEYNCLNVVLGTLSKIRRTYGQYKNKQIGSSKVRALY